jgi:hypothetical protein
MPVSFEKLQSDSEEAAGGGGLNLYHIVLIFIIFLLLSTTEFTETVLANVPGATSAGGRIPTLSGHAVSAGLLCGTLVAFDSLRKSKIL